MLCTPRHCSHQSNSILPHVYRLDSHHRTVLRPFSVAVCSPQARMAPRMVESLEESYLAGHSCKHCQQISFPGTRLPDGSSVKISKSTFHAPISPYYRLGISLNDMREWSDCAFASRLLQHSNEKLFRFYNRDAIQLCAERSVFVSEPNNMCLVWMERVPSDEAVKFERTQNRVIQSIPYLVATKQGQASFMPRKWQSKNKG